MQNSGTTIPEKGMMEPRPFMRVREVAVVLDGAYPASDLGNKPNPRDELAYKQAGNAFPPSVARAVAAQIRDALTLDAAAPTHAPAAPACARGPYAGRAG